ncbi:hypothetical protein [Chromobacterium subtsugae]|uniref:hypothetical protein n=1 Tax=Chromobacterium subtsugae TaxID=251747 RepID=UPI000B272630|nr:hypothetical protein [Chromobacterium subtsugae]
MRGAPLLLVAAVGTAVAAGWLWGPRAQGPAAGATHASQPTSGPAAGRAVAAAAPADGFSFAVGGNPAVQGQAAPPPETPAERQRKQQLRKLGYQIEARYYQMSLAQLRELAKQGNVQALTHLAERYLFQLDGHPGEPGYEAGFRYRDEAREALQQAYALGNMHAAAMISESYLLEKQPLEAAAWNQVARRSGDALSADWFLKTKDYQALTDQQKAGAAQRADQLMQSLARRKPA